MPTHIVYSFYMYQPCIGMRMADKVFLCWFPRRDYYLCLQSLSVSSIWLPLYIMEATLQSKRLWSVLNSAYHRHTAEKDTGINQRISSSLLHSLRSQCENSARNFTCTSRSYPEPSS